MTISMGADSIRCTTSVPPRPDVPGHNQDLGLQRITLLIILPGTYGLYVLTPNVNGTVKIKKLMDSVQSLF
jgi:hypothetical protein